MSFSSSIQRSKIMYLIEVLSVTFYQSICVITYICLFAYTYHVSPTKHIAIDCEFVGVGFEGKDNALARVSIVNQFGHVLLDTLVRPEERVVDYRTKYSGIHPKDLRPQGPARPFREVHMEVAKLCKGRVLVGHSVGGDLKVR